MAEGIQMGTIGAELLATVRRGFTVRNLSSATVKTFKLVKPNSRSVVEFAAAFETDGSDGSLVYTTTATTDLDEPGYWVMQAYLVMPGFTGHTAIGQFYVHSNVDS